MPVLKTVTPRRDLRDKYANWFTVYEGFRLWSHDGTWERTLGAVQVHRRGGYRLGVVRHRRDGDQSIYSQLCRLHWVLSSEVVQPVIDKLGQAARLQSLESGPFNNCGIKSKPITTPSN